MAGTYTSLVQRLMDARIDDRLLTSGSNSNAGII